MEYADPDYDKDMKIRNKLLSEYRKILPESKPLTDNHCTNLCIANETERLKQLNDVEQKDGE